MNISDEKIERRLAAIMITDIVGFTSLTQENEASAMKMLVLHNEILRSIFKRYSGREIKSMGDSFLVEFYNALDAVQCAISVQQAIYEREKFSAARETFQVRIGIHLGDVIEREEDIFGDAVNVCSRIVPIAEPGGVAISGQVYDQVRNKTDYEFTKLEGVPLKNVKLPVDVFKIILPWVAGKDEIKHQSERRIAVLPFRNLSTNPNDEYFAEGITEEIIMRLSTLKELEVIAKTSVMNYKNTEKRISQIRKELNASLIIDGSIRKMGNRVRISVQAIDSERESHLWAKNYDEELDDIFKIQSEVAKRIAYILKVKLSKSKRDQLEKVPTSNTEAYVLYLKGRFHWNIRSKEGIEKAKEYFQMALEHDNSYALGYSGLADCYVLIAKNYIGDPLDASFNAKEYAMKALRLDPDLAEAHATLGILLLYFDHDTNKAEREFQIAIELKPNYATAYQWYSHYLGCIGKHDEALEMIRKAVQLDPLSRAVNLNLADSLRYLDQLSEAKKVIEKILQFDASYADAYLGLLEICVQMKDFDGAMAACRKRSEILKDELEEKIQKSFIYAAKGELERSSSLLAEAEKEKVSIFRFPYMIGKVHLMLGNSVEGFKWFEVAYSKRDPDIMLLSIDKFLRPFRSDPRYVSLLRKTNLLRE